MKPNALRKLLAMRGIHWLATRLGGGVLRRMSFDEMFRSGVWDFSASPSSELVQVVENYGSGGDILMLGCGTGTIASAMRPGSFETFLGVDISPEAITKARKLAADSVQFEVGDMLHYNCSRAYQVILFSEALYYIRPWRRKALLQSLQRHLTPSGQFIVTIAQPARYSGIIQMIRTNFRLLEDRPFSGSSRHLLVFR